MSNRTEIHSVSFKINGKIHDIEIPQDKVALYNNLVDDNEFTLKYLNIMIASKEISLDEELKEIYRIDSNGDLEDKIFSVKHRNIVENKDKWYEPETCFLLEQYEIYIKDVGQSKLYRNKKCMWEQIANDINKKFEMKKTAVQVENRFKNLLRRNGYKPKHRRTDEEEDNNLREKLGVSSLETPPKRKYRKFDSTHNSTPAKKGRILQETLEHIDSEEKAADEGKEEEILILLKKHKAAAERRHEKTLRLLRKHEAVEERIHLLKLQKYEKMFPEEIKNQTESLLSE